MLDREIRAHAALLTGRDQNAAYASLLALEAESAESDGVYPYFDGFAAMLTAKSGLVRTRGLRLIAANARWDSGGKLEELLPEYLRHILDPKPVTARQCIQALPRIAAAKPALAPALRSALAEADFSRYADSMAPLLEQDRAAALEQIGPGPIPRG